MSEDAPVQATPRAPRKQANERRAEPRRNDDDQHSPAATADRKAAPNPYGFNPEHWPAP